MNKLQCPVVKGFKRFKHPEEEKELPAVWRVMAEEYRHENNLSLDQALTELAMNPKSSLLVRSFFAKLICSVKY